LERKEDRNRLKVSARVPARQKPKCGEITWGGFQERIGDVNSISGTKVRKKKTTAVARSSIGDEVGNICCKRTAENRGETSRVTRGTAGSCGRGGKGAGDGA